MHATTMKQSDPKLMAFGPAPGHGMALAQRWVAWAPLVAFPVGAMALRPHLEPWAFMWLLSAAIFAGCKWQTFLDADQSGPRAAWGRSLGYLLWPGMDARAFCRASSPAPAPSARKWAWAAGKTLLGGGLLWGTARIAPSAHPLVAGWVALFGLIFLLHFGSFHLLALAWQRAGVNAQPIMRNPARAKSLSDFWGNRWNLGFRQLSHDLVFRPISQRFGLAAGTLAAFVASGLVHELVISLPAAAGYGLPTAYFLLQGLGVLLERSAFGKRMGLGRGIRGWLFVLLCTAVPLYGLFHPPFVTRVIVPFLHATVA